MTKVFLLTNCLTVDQHELTAESVLYSGIVCATLDGAKERAERIRNEDAAEQAKYDAEFDPEGPKRELPLAPLEWRYFTYGEWVADDEEDQHAWLIREVPLFE